MIQLRRSAPVEFMDPHEVEFPEDVAFFRAILNGAGYDATDLDIQEAYGEWSEDTNCAGWLSVGDDREFYLGILLGHLERA